jgi:hypothetical protein
MLTCGTNLKYLGSSLTLAKDRKEQPEVSQEPSSAKVGKQYDQKE